MSFSQIGCFVSSIRKLLLSYITEISARQSFQPAFHAYNFTWITLLWKKLQFTFTLYLRDHRLAREPEIRTSHLAVSRWEVPVKFLWTGNDKAARHCYIVITSTHAFFSYFIYYFIMQYSRKYIACKTKPLMTRMSVKTFLREA